MDSEELGERFKKYEAEYKQYLMTKYFSDKTLYGGNIYDVKMNIDGQTISAGRFPPFQSFVDPAAFYELIKEDSVESPPAMTATTAAAPTPSKKHGSSDELAADKAPSKKARCDEGPSANPAAASPPSSSTEGRLICPVCVTAPSSPAAVNLPSPGAGNALPIAKAPPSAKTAEVPPSAGTSSVAATTGQNLSTPVPVTPALSANPLLWVFQRESLRSSASPQARANAPVLTVSPPSPPVDPEKLH